MIVERPERILACALGVSQAYVRLGSRHKGGLNPPHPDTTPASHLPFKIRKSSRSVDVTSPAVVAVHGRKWMEELKFMCDSAGTRLSLGMKELARQDEFPASQTEKPTFHEGDLYLCAESLNALQGAVGGVCDAVDQVFNLAPATPQRAFVAVRPPGHHCSSDWPSGFCWINNVHIGIEYAAQTYGLTHAVIFDFDLHHGDGSQDVTWERNTKSAAMPKNAPFNKKTAIGYYSMHDINSYPCEWGDKEKVQNASLCIDNAHGQSIWNVHLEPWRTLDEFWSLYETKYCVLLEKARAFLKRHTDRVKATPKQGSPNAAIFISAGFDASEWEGAGMQRHAVNVPTEFYARFTRDVVKLAQEEGTSVNGKVISVLEGGYSDRALTSGVLSHLSGLCDKPPPQASNEVVSAIQRMNTAAMGIDKPDTGDAGPTYDVDWWHISNITALENYITPPPPPPAPKRPGRLPTYATPTQSFTHKVVDPVTFKRSISGTLRAAPPSPPRNIPPPAVDWIVATHELSKLLIPGDRQTKSCRPEELAPTRAKKDRLSEPPALPVDTGRQLRGRKAKTPDSVASPPDMDAITDALRRQTISDLPVSSRLDTAASSLQSSPIQTTNRTNQLYSSINDKQSTTATLPDPTEPPLVSTRPSVKEPILPKARKPRAPVAKPLKNESNVPKYDQKPAVRPAPKRSPAKARDAPALTSAMSSASDNSDKPSGAGPKRILLKLGTREQSERKTQERLDAEKRQAEEKTSKTASKTSPSRQTPQTETSKAGLPRPGHAAQGVPPSTSEMSQYIQPGGRPLPELEVRVPTPRTAPEPDRPFPLPSRTSHLSANQDLMTEDQQQSRPDTLSGSSSYDQPTSPAVFTPTFMSALQSPVLTPDGAGRNGAAADVVPGATQTGHGYVQYQYPPPQQQHSHVQNGAPATTGVETADMNEMVKQSMIVHPHMVIAESAISPDAGIQGKTDDLPKGVTVRPQSLYQRQSSGYGQQSQMQGVSRDRLPVFSSTGSIPFAPPASSPAMSMARPGSGLGISHEGGHVSGRATAPATKKPADIWEVPETPQK